MSRSLLTVLAALLSVSLHSQTFLPGYHKAVYGEQLNYHAPQPDATVSLLVRSEDSSRYIEWETAPVPVEALDDDITFLMLAGIDVNPTDPHHWIMSVDGVPFFEIPTPLDTMQKTLTSPGPGEATLEFKATQVDRYGDFMGYLYLKLPKNFIHPEKPVTLKVEGQNAGSRTWFMVFMYEATDKVTLTSEQAVQRGGNGEFQVLRAEVAHYGKPVKATIRIGSQIIKRPLEFGYNSLYLPVPRIDKDTSISFVITSGKNTMADKEFTIQPVQKRTIYLLHHSHNDIGYTHVQPEVEQMQWNNLDRALAVAEATKDYPEGAQMKWCTEVMWAVESYYEKLTPEKMASFKQAVQESRIELNAFFANELMSLCGPEELDRLLEAGRRISRECGVGLTSAMITDIPGWSWAIVPALANSGVKYLSLGTNRGHRIGDIITKHGDKPFYWVSPSGEEKVLCWVHGAGYSLFHTGLAYTSIQKRLREDLIFGYLNELSAGSYPYEEVMLRYNIGSDNGPVDEMLPEAVKAWNEKYVTPTVVISTVTGAFGEFEVQHGGQVPELRGDLTCYWEDGAYSTARETVLNRANASRLSQAAALWSIYNPSNYPETGFSEAWRNVLLYDEHTWGSWNSISEPESPFTIQQWEIKKSFALKAEGQSKKLMADALVTRELGSPALDAIEVVNTCTWQRTGLVVIKEAGEITNPKSQIPKKEIQNSKLKIPNTETPNAQSSDSLVPRSPGPLVSSSTLLKDETGLEIPTQLLSDGSLVFIAEDVPGLGSKVYTVSSRQSAVGSQSTAPVILIEAKDDSLQSAVGSQLIAPVILSEAKELITTRFRLQFDTLTGALSSLKWLPQGMELVDTSSFKGLNQYLYVEGRRPDMPKTTVLKSIELVEDGPVMKVVRVVMEAPGSFSYAADYQIIDELNLIRVVNHLNKEKVYDPEAVHIAFPINVPGGTMRYDLAAGYCEVEKDQAPGSNKNFLAMEHWLDISNDSLGVTLICPDAPLFEVGRITMDEIVTGWRDSISPSQTAISYLMNNYWETNYAAAQEGDGSYSYIILPHNGFNPTEAEKEAVAARQPLIARMTGTWLKSRASLFSLASPSLLVISIKPLEKKNEILISIYNSGSQEEPIIFSPGVKNFSFTDPDGLPVNTLTGTKTIPAYGLRYIKIEM